MAPLGVALGAFALLAGAAASSAADQAPAVAEAMTDGAPKPSTLLVDPKPTSQHRYPEVRFQRRIDVDLASR